MSLGRLDLRTRGTRSLFSSHFKLCCCCCQFRRPSFRMKLLFFSRSSISTWQPQLSLLLFLGYDIITYHQGSWNCFKSSWEQNFSNSCHAFYRTEFSETQDKYQINDWVKTFAQTSIGKLTRILKKKVCLSVRLSLKKNDWMSSAFHIWTKIERKLIFLAKH